MQEALTASGWSIVEDTTVERGGCRVGTAQGEADATVEVRWGRILATFGRDGAWMALPAEAAP